MLTRRVATTWMSDMMMSHISRTEKIFRFAKRILRSWIASRDVIVMTHHHSSSVASEVPGDAINEVASLTISRVDLSTCLIAQHDLRP